MHYTLPLTKKYVLWLQDISGPINQEYACCGGPVLTQLAALRQSQNTQLTMADGKILCKIS
jgi:hypothetical protein